MKKLLATTILAGLMAAPALTASAEDAVSCTDFLAMNADAQMEAVHMMSDSMMGDDMASDEMKSDDMKSDGMASDEMKSDDMKSDDMASDDMMAEDMSAEDVVAYCTDHKDMTIADAMHGDM